MNFHIFFLSVTLVTCVGKALTEEEKKPTDDIEVNNRQLFNLGINIGSWGSQSLYTSIPQNQRQIIERTCRSLMSSLATVSVGTPTPREINEDSGIVPSKRLFSFFRSNDPYYNVMDSCTKIMGILGGPSANVPVQG